MTKQMCNKVNLLALSRTAKNFYHVLMNQNSMWNIHLYVRFCTHKITVKV